MSALLGHAGILTAISTSLRWGEGNVFEREAGPFLDSETFLVFFHFP